MSDKQDNLLDRRSGTVGRRNEDLYRLKLSMIANASHVGMWDMQIDPSIPIDFSHPMHYDKKFRRLLGYTDEQDFPNVLRSSMSRIHPDDLATVEKALAAHLADKTGETPYEVKYRAFKKDGSVGFFLDTADTHRDSEGNPLFMAGILADRTDEWLASNTNKRQAAKIASMVKATGLSLWDLEISYTNNQPLWHLRWTNEFRTLIDYDETQLPATNGSWLKIIHPDDRERVVIALHNHLNDRTGETPYHQEYRMRKRSGQYIYVQDQAETLRDDKGRPLNASGAVRDITQAKTLLIETKAAAVAQNNFLSTMAHEIRTPLNVILGLSEIQMQDDAQGDPKPYFEQIYSAGEVLLTLVNDVLDLSKIESDSLEMSYKKYDTLHLLSDVFRTNRMRIGRKKIAFEIDLSPSLKRFFIGDEVRLQQILNHLLSNAFKFTEQGKIKLSVKSESIHRHEELLTLTLSDTGVGMDEAQVDLLFENYSKLKKNTSIDAKAHGVGINTVMSLVQIMDGTIHFESALGKGTTVVIKLPQNSYSDELLNHQDIYEFKRDLQNVNAPADNVLKETMAYGKVLIVDDIETNIYVAKGLLSPYQLQMDAVTDGIQAIEKIQKGNTYDLIFMDHMMPGLDGLETTKRLRDLGYTQPIVALTANVVLGQAQLFMDNGFDDFMSKPIDTNILNLVLNRYVRDAYPLEVRQAYQEAMADGAIVSDPSTHKKSRLQLELAQVFIKDATKSLDVLTGLMASDTALDAKQLRTYTIHVHGLKSGLANIGKPELSNTAKALENYGREQNLQQIDHQTPPFLAQLQQLITELTPPPATVPKDPITEDKALLERSLQTIVEACGSLDDLAIEDTLDQLQAHTWSQRTSHMLQAIRDQILLSGFDEIPEIIRDYQANT